MKIDYQPKQFDYGSLYGDNKAAFFAKAVPFKAATVHLKKIRVCIFCFLPPSLKNTNSRLKVNARGWGELIGKKMVEAYVPYFMETQLWQALQAITPIRSILNM